MKPGCNRLHCGRTTHPQRLPTAPLSCDHRIICAFGGTHAQRTCYRSAHKPRHCASAIRHPSCVNVVLLLRIFASCMLRCLCFLYAYLCKHINVNESKHPIHDGTAYDCGNFRPPKNILTPTDEEGRTYMQLWLGIWNLRYLHVIQMYGRCFRKCWWTFRLLAFLWELM